jgi:hypothetical protein
MKMKSVSVMTSHPANIATAITGRYVNSSLESFRLQRQPPRHYEGSQHLLPAQIKRDLANSSNTLQKLILEDSVHIWGEDTEFDQSIMHMRLGSMLNFRRLRILNIQESMILGRAMGSKTDPRLRHSADACADFVNGFPSSLERLVITKCTPAIFDAIYKLLFNSSRWPENLKSIEVGAMTPCYSF